MKITAKNCSVLKIVKILGDNPTRNFLTNQIAAFFKSGQIKLILS
jgi:hypothetical protein